MPTLAIAIFVAVFAIATFRNIHLGVLHVSRRMRGRRVAGGHVASGRRGRIPRRHPGPARGRHLLLRRSRKGTARSIASFRNCSRRVGARRGLLPFLFFLITAGVAAMGSPQAGYVVMPLAMPAARRSGVDPMLMAVAINAGISAGGLAPTSLFGIVTQQHGPSGRHRSQSPHAPGGRDRRESGIDCCRHMVVPGLERGHDVLRLRNRAGAGSHTRTIHLTSDRDAHLHHRADSLRDHRLLAGTRAGHRRDRVRIRRRSGPRVPRGGSRRRSPDRSGRPS